MFSLKKIGVSFVIGFTISLIAGIASGVDFGTLLLRAILSGLFFALVVNGAIVLYQKFLLNEDFGFDTLHENTVARPGSNVDITVDGDDLPDSASAPSFSLGEEASSGSVDVQRKVVLDQQTGDSFRSGELNTVAASGLSQVVKNKTDAPSHETENKTFSVSKKETQDEANMGLDILPDIEGIVGDDKASGSVNEGQVIQDTVFAETGETKPIAPTGFSDMGDARDIAAAIRTVLAKDT